MKKETNTMSVQPTEEPETSKPFFFRFFIGYPKTAAGKKDWNRRYSLNAYYAGKHWNERIKDAEYWHALVWESLYTNRCVGEKRLFEGPVTLSFLFNDGLDCSNHAAMAKMIEDALKGVIIKDDSPKYVKGIYVGFHDKPYISISVKEHREEE